jgi:Glycosyl transferases group 1
MNRRNLQKIAFISMTTEFGGHEVMFARWLQEVHAQGAVQPVLWSSINPKLAQITASEDYEQIFSAPPARMLQRLPGAAHKLIVLTWLLLKFLRLRWAYGITVAVVSEGSLMGEPLATMAARLAFKSMHLYVPLVDSYHAMGYPDPDGATARFMCIYRHRPHSWITLSEAKSVLFRTWADVTQPAQVFVQSYAQALADMGFFVHLVGDGHFKKEIEGAIASSTIVSRMLGLSACAAPIACMARADCTLIPSRSEGIPLVMHESMAMGVPMVANDLPGTRGYLHPECIFKASAIATAMAVVKRLRDDKFRNTAIQHNLQTYEMSASLRTFSYNCDLLISSINTATDRPKIDR